MLLKSNYYIQNINNVLRFEDSRLCVYKTSEKPSRVLPTALAGVDIRVDQSLVIDTRVAVIGRNAYTNSYCKHNNVAQQVCVTTVLGYR